MHRKKTSFPSAAQTHSQHMHAHISVCHCLSRGVFKQQLKSPVAGSQCDNGSYLEMSCSCKAVIILINYLLWALTRSCGNTYTVSRSAQPVFPFVLSVCACYSTAPWSQLFPLVWISCRPWSFSFALLMSSCLWFFVSSFSVPSDLKGGMHASLHGLNFQPT